MSKVSSPILPASYELFPKPILVSKFRYYGGKINYYNRKLKLLKSTMIFAMDLVSEFQKYIDMWVVKPPSTKQTLLVPSIYPIPKQVVQTIEIIYANLYIQPAKCQDAIVSFNVLEDSSIQFKLIYIPIVI